MPQAAYRDRSVGRKEIIIGLDLCSAVMALGGGTPTRSRTRRPRTCDAPITEHTLSTMPPRTDHPSGRVVMPHSGLRVAPRNAYTSAPSADPCMDGYGFDSGGGFSGGASRAARSSSASISAAVHVRAGGRGDVRRHSAGFATHDLSSFVVTRRNVHRARAASTATLMAAPALPHPTTQRCDQPHGTTWSTPGGFSFCFERATPIRPSDAACVIARWTVRTEQPTFAASFDRNAQQSRCDPMLPRTSARVVVIPRLRARSKIARASDGTGPSQRDDTAAAVTVLTWSRRRGGRTVCTPLRVPSSPGTCAAARPARTEARGSQWAFGPVAAVA